MDYASDPGFLNFMTGLSTFGVIIVLILTLLWIILPFAVFGIKSKLDLLAQRVDVMNRQLAETNQILRAGFNIPADEQ